VASEASLQSSLIRACEDAMPGALVWSHTDKMNAGIPDVSLNWAGTTTWIEVKYMNPRFIDRGIQRHSLKRAERAAQAYYVVYHAAHRCVYVVLPRFLEEVLAHKMTKGCLHTIAGYKHAEVAGFFKLIHQTRRS